MLRAPKSILSAVAAAILVAFAVSGDAATASKDAAARGLDAFVHTADKAAPGGTLSLQALVYGFPTVTTLAPLPGAVLEAVWDPESLGKHEPSAPPVRATSDKAGRIQLDVPVPQCDTRKLRLLVGLQSGEHRRTRTVTVQRVAPYEVSVHVQDNRVVPGTQVPAFVLVRDATTLQPAANSPVELSLLEGGMVRQSVQLRTDVAGSASGRISIPPIDEPGWSWTLRARVPASSEHDSGQATTGLSPREETPGKPRISTMWSSSSVLAGEKVTLTIRVRDATSEPVANLPVKYWVGRKGMVPPADPAKWDKSGTTDRNGVLEATVDAPSTVSPIVGTELTVAARAKLDGHELEDKAVVTVGQPTPWIRVLAGNRTLVPGLQHQLLLLVMDGFGKPVKGTFLIKAHGLDTQVSTNEEGEAVIPWKVPADIGARRNVGPCAGGVASVVTITPKESIPSFGTRTRSFEECVTVDREASAMVEVTPPVVRAGGKVRVRVSGGAGTGWSVLMRSNQDAAAAGAWLDDGEQGGEVLVPPGAAGVWTVTAVSPGNRKKARHARAAMLAIPSVLPKLQARLVGGRTVPGGDAQLEAALTDEHGKGLQGAVAAVIWDMNGGGVPGLSRMDTRRWLCDSAGIEAERCDRFLEGNSALDPLRRGQLGNLAEEPTLPVHDPGADVDEQLTAAFAEVIHSLEGAVMESTESPERLRDTRTKTAAGWSFNPELWTLVTAAMDKQPETPGGEPFSMADAVAMDPQVTFDNVARRVSRLKLLRVLVEVRNHIKERYSDPGEPALRDPSAILRRLVRDGKLAQSAVLDPWGGTMDFVRANGPGTPFLTVRGMALHAPGPDGRLGTPDDVRDPFERVARSGSPYARATSEDRVVDARLDMEVADATVSAWQALLEELTGTRLGHGGGTGTGQGFGSGHGRLGGSHRSKPPSVRMGATSVHRSEAVWLQPVRTDENGRVKLTVPLGAIDTTYAVTLVGIPDTARPAVTHVEVPANLPISARIQAGEAWTEGDEVEVGITMRNRTALAARASIQAVASGVASLVRPEDGRKTIEIPAKGSASTSVRVKAPRPGEAALQVKLESPGVGSDTVHESWTVRPAGEPTEISETVWVEGEQDVAVPAEGAAPAKLVLERGFEPAIVAAMEALDPDRMRTPEATADSLEVAARVHRWALARGGEADKTALRAAELARRAAGRLKAWHAKKLPRAGWQDVEVRARATGTLLEKGALPNPAECPPAGVPTLASALDYLDSEPAPVGGAVTGCWDSFVTTATELVMKSADPVAYSRAILALAERSHRAHTAGALADRLREVGALRASGMIRLPGKAATDRSARALAYAALARASGLGKASAAPRGRLLAWLAAQVDAQGGYGSPLATRSAVRAFLAASSDTGAATKVTMQTTEGTRQLQVHAGASLPVALARGVTSVRLKTEGKGVLARVVRSQLRRWSEVPAEVDSPVQLDVVWPSDARAGKVSRVRVVLRHSVGRATTVDARIPLPPGARMAEWATDVRQLQGQLMIRWNANDSALPHVMEIPVRFALAGAVTVPEAHARLAHDEAGRAIAPARPLRVAP